MNIEPPTFVIVFSTIVVDKYLLLLETIWCKCLAPLISCLSKFLALNSFAPTIDASAKLQKADSNIIVIADAKSNIMSFYC